MLTEKCLREILFDINNHDRKLRSNLPNSIEREVQHKDMVKIRHEKQKNIAKKKGKMSKDVFEEEDEVRVQCPKTRRWHKKGVIIKKRGSNDGSQTSFEIKMDDGGVTVRHKQHICHSIRSSQNVSVHESALRRC